MIFCKMSDDLCLTNGCENDVVSPVEGLVVNWGYEPIMPRNDVVWEELSTTTHVFTGIYLFAVGNHCRLLPQAFDLEVPRTKL